MTEAISGEPSPATTTEEISEDERAERRGVSTGPVGQWTYRHRRGLRIGAVTLMTLILVFWGQPTALAVILLVVILLILLGLIELIARAPAEPAAVGQE